jgi:hypothetical protein
MVVLLQQDHLVLQVALGMLSVVLYTVMRVDRFSTIRKLLPINYNSSRALVLASYIITQSVLLGGLLLGWEGHFSSNKHRKLLRDYSNYHLVVHPCPSIKYLELRLWDKVDNSPF